MAVGQTSAGGGGGGEPIYYLFETADIISFSKNEIKLKTPQPIKGLYGLSVLICCNEKYGAIMYPFNPTEISTYNSPKFAEVIFVDGTNAYSLEDDANISANIITLYPSDAIKYEGTIDSVELAACYYIPE